MTSEALADAVPTSPEWTVLHGWVHAYGDDDTEGVVNLAALTARLRTSAIASVSASQPEAGESATVGLLITVEEEPRVAVQTPDGPVAGITVQELADQLAAELDVSFSIGDVWAGRDDEDEDEDLEDDDFGGEEAADADDSDADSEADADADEEYEDEDEWVVEHPVVIISKVPESALPQMAHDFDVELVTTHSKGWTIATAERDFILLEHHGWLPSELPAASVGRSGERRYVTVLAKVAQPVEFGLVRFDDLIPVLDPTGVPAELVAALTNPHLAPGSAARQLCETKRFAHLDPRDLSVVLQSPMDDRWTSRVLATLGMPLLAAEIAEHRTELGPGAAVIPVRGLWGVMGEMVDRYYRAPDYEVAGRTFVGKSYAALTATPARVAATMVGDTVLATAAFYAAGKTSGRRARKLRALGALFAADAVGHAVLAPRKFSR